ncbi:MAG: hypothetical protein JRI80_04145 [Deltaproteobacteria bacterium]|nr:hypothetical protein [Deltaproteobacteria bacterium]
MRFNLSVYWRYRVVLVILGIVGGFLVLHPYAMLVYTLMHPHEGQGLHLHLNELISQPLAAFRPIMLPMVISFILFGGVIGLLVSISIERRKRLLATEDEHEKKKIALETMKELMATLSHHLLNANMVIGGRARAVAKMTTNEKILEDLRVITEEGRRIDAVIRALGEAIEVKIADYTSGGSVKMIDIGKDLEDRIEAFD